jgi:uncharacterized protein
MGETRILASDGRTVCRRCSVATSPVGRTRGLLGREGLAHNEGMLLRPARAVHTWFMRFPIDIVFLAKDGTVLAVREHVRPWRTAAARGARSVLELAAGECARRGIAAGDRLALVESSG